MSLADGLGGAGGWIGAQMGQNATEWEKLLMLERLKEEEKQANGLDPQGAFKQDPALRMAQMKALAQMGQVASAGGMDPQSLAAEAQGQRAAAGQEKSQRGAILNDAQARGVSGGGAELAAQLEAQQSGANRSAAVGEQAAADARSRALAAMSNYAQLASGVRSQDLGGQEAMWNAGLQKYGAQKDARAGVTNYYGADRAQTIGNLAAGGQAVGAQYGAAGDAGISYASGGLGGGKGKAPTGSATSNPAFEGVDYDYFNKLYGKP